MSLSFAFSRRAIALLFCFLFTLLAASLVSADDAAKLPDLPLATSFAKGTPGENGGPYALTLTNTSDHALALKATIIWSVTSHNRARSIHLDPKELAAGASWTIDDLAVEDRVVVEAEGFAKLDIKTPPGKKSE